jgi:hypothetical protein
MKIKILGIIFALVGGILGLVSSISYFFADKFMYNLDYNRSNLHGGETITIVGVFIFLISVATLVLALFAFKHHYSKKLFIILISLGAILLALLSFSGVVFTLSSSFIAALLILAGGIIGDIGVSLDSQ